MTFAANTSTSVARSKEEIERIITRAGAVEFATANREDHAIVTFKLNSRVIMFELDLPKLADFKQRVTPTGRVKDTMPHEQLKLYEQACRSAWRGLALCVKSKLVSVEMEIETFDEAFLAHIVVKGPSGKAMRFASLALDAIAKSADGKPMQLMLGSGS